MKTKVKRNVTNGNDQQQNRNDTRNETDGRADGQDPVDEPGTRDSNAADAQNTQRQGSRSGRKSRDNFGSYKGY